MIFLSSILDAGVTVSTEISLWSILLPIIITVLTGGLIALGTKFLDRDKTTAEQRKISAEEKKLRVEADSLENEEWRKLYAETKNQYTQLKKDSDEQIEKYKKESGEQMEFLKKQISIHSDTLELQSSNFETQEQVIQELRDEIEIEKTARIKLELIVKKFQQWAVRNKAKIANAQLEPVPVEIYNY
jgi:hypothetical protein